MFSEYFDDWDVRLDYCKEYVSLWGGWLGKENHHKLDEVSEAEWARFNDLLRNISRDFSFEAVDCDNQILIKVADIESVLSTYKESMNKNRSQFTKLVVPDLKCVITEEWDYTYIIWHRNDGAVESLKPYITASKLEHFHD